MQSLNWYANRLRQMSPREIAWRTQSFVRSQTDRPRIALGLVPRSEYDATRAREVLESGLPLCEHAPPHRSGDPTAHVRHERLIRQADVFLRHRFSFFGLTDRDLGNPIDWNRDHETGEPTPLRYAADIDYRDPRVAGDAKVVWEPGRHHQLVVLGRAYRVTADARYAREALSQIDSWLQQCPFGIGMHWRSPLELAIRAINWVWTIDLIRPSGVLAGEAAARVLNGLHLHLWDIQRKYSRGSSANNHRIGEAAALFIATTCLPGLKSAGTWAEESRRILEEEITAQTYEDGGSREQAFSYHMFVLQFLMLAAVSARRAAKPLSAGFHARLGRMLEFVAGLIEGGPAPAFGDSDDGYVIDLGDDRDPRGWLSAGASLLDRPDLALDAGSFGDTAHWLLGRTAPSSAAACGGRLAPRAFPHSGYYLLQCGARGERGAISIVFDCGELGFGPLAAHGHADALAFTLRIGGHEVLVDPGTYDYFRFPEWRDYFRSTRAHNTIAVDGRDQSVMLGPFMWGRRASAWCERWDPDGGTVSAAHDGYARGADPVRHARELELDGGRGILTVTDHLRMGGEHHVSLAFHFAEHCRVSHAGDTVHAETPAGPVTLQADARLGCTLLQGSETPIGGWVSRRYHLKAPVTTVVLSGRFAGETRLVSRISVMSAATRGDAAP
jgi:hypothetical protein